MSGAGETQLEIERRVISDKEAKIRRELLTETATRKQLRQRRKASHNAMPTIALVCFFVRFSLRIILKRSDIPMQENLL